MTLQFSNCGHDCRQMLNWIFNLLLCHKRLILLFILLKLQWDHMNTMRSVLRWDHHISCSIRAIFHLYMISPVIINTTMKELCFFSLKNYVTHSYNNISSTFACSNIIFVLHVFVFPDRALLCFVSSNNTPQVMAVVQGLFFVFCGCWGFYNLAFEC